MNCQKLFQDFNSSKFVVFTSLLVFSILFALRLDGTIQLSWWLVFSPLWIWKCLVVSGALVGVLVWSCNPEYRLSDSSYTHFKSMLISLSLQLLLLMFEILVCDKLESDRHFWTLAFIPLIFISLLSVAVSVWALKNERDFELELFCSVNVLQFIFIALRLDRFITWSWVVVFVPLWILLCLAIIAVLYALIFAVILFRTPEVSAEQRKASFYTAIAYILVVLPLLLFFVLLSSKLDAKEYRGYHHHHHHHHVHLHGFGEIGGSTGATFIEMYPPHISNGGGQSTSMPDPVVGPPPPPLITQQHPPPPPPPPPFFGSPYSFDMDYFSVCIPLYFTLSILICMSFSSKGGNLWWFGMRKDFCSFLLILCPCLREYGNISYSFRDVSPSNQQPQQQQNERTNLTAAAPSPPIQNFDYYDSGPDRRKSPTSHGNNRWNKKSGAITQQPGSVIIANFYTLDMPD